MRVVVAILALAGALGSTRPAGAVTVNDCLAHKLGDVGKAAALEAACDARNASKPDATMEARCLGKAVARFTGGDDPARGVFAKRERRPPCTTVGDQDAVAASVAAYVSALEGAVGTSIRPSRCDSAKITCMARYVSSAFACLARAAGSTGTIDAQCLAVQAGRLGGDTSGCLGKAAVRGDCSTTGDGAALASAAEAYVASTLCALDPGGTVECGALPTPAPTPTRTPTPIASRTPTPRPTGGGTDAEQICVDTINQYRASIGVAPLARWSDAEACVEDQGFADSESGVPHSAFGQCSEWAQDECPDWPGPPDQMIGNCLAVMWAEGPGQPYSQHGHYINMSNSSYTKVACGFAVLSDGRVWAVQDFR